MRAVLYARVSSAIQRDRETIASQLRVLPAFIASQGWELVKPANTYVDDGRSAKAGQLEKRTGLALLLHDAALGLFDVVVVVDVDRLTRSEDLAERGAILGALQHAKVKIASSTSGQVLDLSTSTGDLFTTLHAFFAAEWTRKHRERVNQGKLTAIHRNRKPGGRAPWGLAYDKTTHTWSVDPVRGPFVVEMFERVAGGESCRVIADDFHRRNVPRGRGGEWSRGPIARMIRSRYAIGEWVADKGRGLKITVPAIVDLDLWQRANDALNESGHKHLRKTKHDYLIEGLAVCGACGAPIGIRTTVWDPRHNGRHELAVYRCRRRRDFRIGEEPCRAPMLKVADVDARVWDAIRVELEDPELAIAIDRELAGRTEEREAWQADADGYRGHLARLERVQAGVLERWRRGMISDAGVDLELGRITREREAVTTQLRVAEEAQAAQSDVRARLTDARAVLAELRAVLADSTFAVRRRLVELLVPRGGITFAGERLRVTMLVPRSSQARAGSPPVLVDTAANRTRHETHLRIRVVA